MTISPAVGVSVPAISAASAAWPLPETPARPVISPPRSESEIPSSDTPDARRVVETALRTRRSGPGSAGATVVGAISCPTISAASSARVVSAVTRSPASLPARSTRTRSLIAMTSLSLCEMKMIDKPCPTRSFSVAKSASVSAGVSTAVGSSRIRIFASR